jgi:hypothetical protein
LINKIMVKEKSTGVDMIFPWLIAWFFIQLKSKNDIILIRKIMEKKNQLWSFFY